MWYLSQILLLPMLLEIFYSCCVWMCTGAYTYSCIKQCLPYIGPPSIREFIVSDNCSTDASISWDPSSTDPVCLPVSYDVTISPSDGVVMMRINDTSYNFTGLRHNDTYTVTINASNSAGNIDDLFNHSLTTAGIICNFVWNFICTVIPR